MEKLHSLFSALAAKRHIWFPLTSHCPAPVTRPHQPANWPEHVQKPIEHGVSFLSPSTPSISLLTLPPSIAI